MATTPNIQTTANAMTLPVAPFSATAVATTANTSYTDTPTNSVLLAPQYLLNPNPFSVIIGTATVTVTQANHGLATGDTTFIAGATAVGGITPAGAYQVTVLTSSTYIFIHGSNASSSATGGGSAVTVQNSRTGGTGAVITKITALARATSTATECQLFVSPDGGATKRFIKSVLLAAYTVSQIMANAGADFGYTVSSPLIMGPSETLYVAIGVSNTGIVFRAEGGMF